MISFEYHYLLVMALVLYAMHLFWTFFLLKIGLESFRGHQEMENIHENDKAND